MSNLSEILLQDANGQYHYKGVIAKAYQNFLNKGDWLFFVGYEGTQGRFWAPPAEEISLNQAVINAIEWYLEENLAKA